MQKNTTNDLVKVSEALKHVQYGAMSHIEKNCSEMRTRQSRSLFNRLHKTIDAILVEYYKKEMQKSEK